MQVPNLKLGPIDSRIFVYLVTLGCNMFIFSLIFYSRSNREFILAILSFLFVSALSFMFIRSLYTCTHQHNEMEELTANVKKQQEHMNEMEKQRLLFSLGLSEKLRTPLQVMYGYSSMILEGAFGAPSNEAHEVVERIFTSIGKMMALLENIISGIGSNTKPVEWSKSKNGLTQMDSLKSKDILLKLIMFSTTIILLVQIILAPNATNVFAIALITILGMLGGFFLVNEMKHEPESDDTLKNLANDLSLAHARNELLEGEREELLSQISTGLRAPLVVAIDEVWQLSQGNRGEISNEAKEATVKILEMKRSLIASVSELVNVLSNSRK